MPASTPEITHAGDRVIVEARTAAEGLAVVTRELGTSARVVAVETVLRGGVAGFFARQLVQIVAEPAVGAPATAAPPASGLAPTSEPVVTSGSETAPAARTSTFAALLRVAAESDTGSPSKVARTASGPGPAVPGAGPGTTPPSGTGDSPVAIALTRLLSGAVDAATFGDALRAELQRTGWRPEHGNPARGAAAPPAAADPQVDTAAGEEAATAEIAPPPGPGEASRIIRVDDAAPSSAAVAAPAGATVRTEAQRQPVEHRLVLEPVQTGAAPASAGSGTRTRIVLEPVQAAVHRSRAECATAPRVDFAGRRP